jgi:hypothetical protein
VKPLFEKGPNQFGIGGALPPKRYLTRFVKYMATCCSYSEEKEDSEATLESPSCYKPVHKCASLTRTLVLVLEHFLILA